MIDQGKKWMDSVKAGDRLHIKPEWNASEGQARNRFTNPVEVLAIERRRGFQDGIAVTVRTNGGERRHLSIGWFEAPLGEYGTLPFNLVPSSVKMNEDWMAAPRAGEDANGRT